MMAKRISRRRFARDGGMLIVSFSLAGQLSMENPLGETPVSAPKQLAPEYLDSWLAIAEDGSVTAYCGRIDMGTGTETAFAQIVAEELDVAFERVKMILGDTGLTPDQGKTTSSNCMAIGAQPLRAAAAEARQFLLQLASKKLGAPLDRLAIKQGVVRVEGDPARKISYGELIGGRRFDLQLKVEEVSAHGPTLKGSARLKSPSEYTIVGKSVPRVDIPAKVTGSFAFVQDLRLPGMLHGRVVRPPAIGAELVSLDPDSVKHIPGLVKVVRKGNFVGVVAEREEAAIRAARELKVTWSKWEGLPEFADLYRATRKARIVKTEARKSEGDVELAFKQAAKVLAATYEYPIQLHAMIGPSCAVADVKDGHATVWSGTQWPQGTRRDLARMLGIPVENVRLIWVEASGSYGRLGCDDAAADAALLSQAVGRPVRVQWMRQDEHGWEPVSPAMVMDLRGALDSQGNVIGWEFEQWSPSHSEGEVGNLVAWRLMGTAPGWDRLSGGGGRHLYSFPNQRTVAHYIEPLLRTIYLRAPGGIQNNFAIESFVDELAAASGADPIEFRLRHLKDEGAAEVLKAVAELAGWKARPSPEKRVAGNRLLAGRGVAFGEHTRGQRVAMIAEVEVEPRQGQVRVRKAFVASDCGLIVNPDGLKNQIEGAVLQGISRTLMEEVKFNRSAVTSLNWRSYPILTFPDVPDLEIAMLNRTNRPPSGAGEVATVPTAAAIANAIFDATGVRLRRVPFTPERLKSALG